MKKTLIFTVILLFIFLAKTSLVLAEQTLPLICGCPTELDKVYEEKGTGEICIKESDPTKAFQEFNTNQATKHLWVEDQKITTQGKADDRARQFIYWVITHNGIDNHPVLFNIWGTVRNIAYFFTILSAALLGLAIIIGQRTNFDTGVKIWPSVMKILGALLYISFSATIVITVVQLSEVMMKFFVENLGGKDLFNIYFSGISKEENYINFVGCRDLNIRVQEAVNTEITLLKLTNFSYYLIGGMLLLRKIILWFLLFVSPFLSVLMFFAFIKNVGWIWIRVFFQWVFYGPLLALFLGGLASIWKVGIPYTFDFSRIGTAQGYIYPTAISILYGGPAQKLSPLNNGNYIDTFVEYIITLIMLWAVAIFPWFLLRTFRDYCCEGINAMKNIMLNNLNKLGGTPPPTPPVIPSQTTSLGVSMQMPNQETNQVKTRIETIEEIKKAKTEEIVRSLDIKASKITDVAHFETNKTTTENITKNINYLKNPTSASTAGERLKYMNLRSELSSRALKSDTTARRVINSFVVHKINITEKEDIIKTLPKTITILNAISIKTKLPSEKVQTISSSFTNQSVKNSGLVSAISDKTKIDSISVQKVLDQLQQNISIAEPGIIVKISINTGLEKEKVAVIIKEFFNQMMMDSNIFKIISEEQQLKEEDVKRVLEIQKQLISDPEKNIEETITVSPEVTLDEYEQVKKMWINAYEKGEIPKTENIRTREEWVQCDIVLITNALNKLLSDDKTLKAQALDEIGFILPIFLINNLSGDQLITYLKAKIEAAKQVGHDILKEKEITQKLKAKSEEELIDVFKPKKKEAGKTMEMKEE
ncbi:MAG: hypothetical protein V1803_01710, partial [Candidatus Roizmanbacteria bacterium]